MLNLLRLALCLVFAFTAGMAAYRAAKRSGTVRAQLVVSGVTNVALFFGQLTLFGTPVTVRTWLSILVAVTDLWWVWRLFHDGPPPVSQL